MINTLFHCVLLIILIICFKFWHKYSNKILESAMTKDERLMLFLQQCKKLDVDDFIEHILPRMQANCAYPVISGLYLFVNNDAKKVYIKQTDDVYDNLAKLCTGNVTSFLDSIVQMDYHDEYDVSCYYWSGDLCDNFDKYIDKIYQIFMDCGYEKYVCPV